MIRLEKFTEHDFAQLIGWIDSPWLQLQWSGVFFTYPLDDQQLQRYVQQTNVLAFKAIEEKSGRTIGHIALQAIDTEHRSARIGKVLIGDSDARGKGYADKMVYHILSIAFDELNLHRVGLGVFDFNEAAIACYRRTGFQTEGVQRDVRQFEGEYWSLRQMSILEHEWEARKGFRP